jgi:CBS domain-containing protein
MATLSIAEWRDRAGVRVRDIMTEQVLTITADDDVRLAVQMMLWGGFRHLPVVEGQRLVGVVTEHDVNRAQAAQLAPGHAKIGSVMTKEPATAKPDEPLEQVALRMADARVGSLPVVEEGRLVGIVTSYDVLTQLGQPPARTPTSNLQVADVMSTAPRAVGIECTLADALAEMVHAEVRHLPVVDGSFRVVGILSDRDVRGAVGDPVAALRGESFEETLALGVTELMKPNPIVARAEQPLDDLAWALLDERVGALPVVDEGGRLVGIVSYVDVLHAAMRGKAPSARDD